MTGRVRRLTSPWPFLWSVVPKRGLVRNLPPIIKRRRLRKVQPSNLWKQEVLL